MRNEQDFSAFLRNLRVNDPETVRQFVEKYRPIVSQIVAGKLAKSDVQRVCDASDICQDVLPHFLRFLQKGEGKFESLENLVAYLVCMALNKVDEAWRRHQARGGGKLVRLKHGEISGSKAVAESGLEDSSSTPSHRVGNREIIAGFRQQLAPDLVAVLDLYLQGLSWEEIGAALGRSSHALRVRFNRARDKYRQDVNPDLLSDS
ncbi:MAG: hypothetical protein JSS02_29710 [Planctomycetes bacterium]|nr:hypothetical protein [Planctomycetota bacterium]